MVIYLVPNMQNAPGENLCTAQFPALSTYDGLTQATGSGIIPGCCTRDLITEECNSTPETARLAKLGQAGQIEDPRYGMCAIRLH